MRFLKLFLVLGMLFPLSGCLEDIKSALGVPVELEPKEQFETSFRPTRNPQDAVLKILQNSGLAAIETKANENPPGYIDLEFFPVLDSQTLDTFEPSRIVMRGERPDFSNIDFQKNFVFLVAHPGKNYQDLLKSEGPALFVTKVKVSYPDDRVTVDLSAGRVGNMDMIKAMSGRWEVEIYVIEKRERPLLQVDIDERTYHYSLVNINE